MTDPIADMLTRIRNAITAKKETVEIPASNMKKAIAEILLSEGYVKDVKIVEDGYNGKIAITLKYSDKKSVINGLQRKSKPGLRAYSGVEDMPRVLGGLGTVILSTNKGILTGKQAKAANVGGEPQKKQPIKKIKKPGRNDPCPCGKLRPNGLPMKYKDCCGRNQ